MGKSYFICRFISLLLIIFAFSIPSYSYVLLHDRNDEFMNYAADKGIMNSISLAWGGSLVDMKAEDKVKEYADIIEEQNDNQPKQALGANKISTYSFLDIQYNLSNSPWFSFALEYAQSLANKKKEKDMEAIKYSEYYFGKNVDVFKGEESGYIGAIGLSFETENKHDQKSSDYFVVKDTNGFSENVPLVKKRDAAFKMMDLCVYADAASPGFLNILSFRTGLGYVKNDKLNSLYDNTTYNYDYYWTDATAMYLKYGATVGLKAGIFLAMLDFDCRTSLTGTIHDKNAASDKIQYGTLAIYSPTSYSNTNFFKMTRASLILALDFSNVRISGTVGADVSNLHYKLLEDRYETTSIIRMDVVLGLTISW